MTSIYECDNYRKMTHCTVFHQALAGVGLEEIPRRKIWLDSKVQGVHVKFVWEIIVTTSQFSVEATSFQGTAACACAIARGRIMSSKNWNYRFHIGWHDGLTVNTPDF